MGARGNKQNTHTPQEESDAFPNERGNDASTQFDAGDDSIAGRSAAMATGQHPEACLSR